MRGWPWAKYHVYLFSLGPNRTSSEIKAVQKALSNSRWKHIFLRSISMDGALDMLTTMCYTNLRFIIIIIIIKPLI